MYISFFFQTFIFHLFSACAVRQKGFYEGAGLEGSGEGRGPGMMWFGPSGRRTKKTNARDVLSLCKDMPSIQGSVRPLLCFGPVVPAVAGLLDTGWLAWPPIAQVQDWGPLGCLYIGTSPRQTHCIGAIVGVQCRASSMQCLYVWVRICQRLCSCHCFFSHKSKANKISYTNQMLWPHYR